MVDFIFKALVKPAEPEGDIYAFPELYKKETWPELPRKGDWFKLDERLYYDVVYDVWHGRNEAGKPVIYLEVLLSKHDYDTLASLPNWSQRDPRND